MQRRSVEIVAECVTFQVEGDMKTWTATESRCPMVPRPMTTSSPTTTQSLPRRNPIIVSVGGSRWNGMPRAGDFSALTCPRVDTRELPDVTVRVHGRTLGPTVRASCFGDQSQAARIQRSLLLCRINPAHPRAPRTCAYSCRCEQVRGEGLGGLYGRAHIVDSFGTGADPPSVRAGRVESRVSSEFMV